MNLEVGDNPNATTAERAIFRRSLGLEPNAVEATASAGAVVGSDESTRVLDLTLDASTTLAFPSLPNRPAEVAVILRQDGVGGRLVTWPAGMIWDGGVAPTLQTGARGIDVIDLLSYDAGVEIFGKRRIAYPGWNIIDNFTRANNTVLGTSSSGAAWTLVSGAFSINTNKAITVATQNDCVATVATGRTAAYTLRADLTSNATTLRTSLGLIGHYVDSSNFILVVFYHTAVGGGGTGGFTIFKKVLGSFTSLYDSGASAYSMGVATTHTVEVDFRGTSVAVRLDGLTLKTQALTAPEQVIFGAEFDVAGIRAYTSADGDAGGSKIDNLWTKSL